MYKREKRKYANYKYRKRLENEQSFATSTDDDRSVLVVSKTTKERVP